MPCCGDEPWEWESVPLIRKLTDLGEERSIAIHGHSTEVTEDMARGLALRWGDGEGSRGAFGPSLKGQLRKALSIQRLATWLTKSERV